MADRLPPEERLVELEREKREIKFELSRSRERKLKDAAEYREKRDEKIKKTAVVLLEIQKEIFDYNKAGVTGKGEINILEKIHDLAKGLYTDLEEYTGGENNDR